MQITLRPLECCATPFPPERLLLSSLFVKCLTDDVECVEWDCCVKLAWKEMQSSEDWDQAHDVIPGVTANTAVPIVGEVCGVTLSMYNNLESSIIDFQMSNGHCWSHERSEIVAIVYLGTRFDTKVKWLPERLNCKLNSTGKWRHHRSIIESSQKLRLNPVPHGML